MDYLVSKRIHNYGALVDRDANGRIEDGDLFNRAKSGHELDLLGLTQSTSGNSWGHHKITMWQNIGHNASICL